MGLFVKANSPFWWMLLEGHGRKRESTGIKREASSAQVRKALRAQAEEVYHARMVQLARAKVGLPLDSAVTFAEFRPWYEQHHVTRHRAADRTRRILDLLEPHFGSVTLPEIKPARWTEYESTRLAAGVSQNTIGRELATMKAVLNAAVGQHLEVNPLVHVKRKSKRLPPKRTITAADETRLIEALAPGKVRGGTHGDDEMLDLYLVGVGTLLRQLNLVNLRRAEHRGDSLVIGETKGGRPHTVPLTGPTVLQRRAAMVLKRRMPRTHGGYFFPKWQARFAKDRDGANAKFLQGFRRACTRAGIPWGLKNHGVVWHTATRATGATRMLRDYHVDVGTVQLLGGWSSLDQMAQYLGIDQTWFTRGAPSKGRTARSAR
jgi:integrase